MNNLCRWWSGRMPVEMLWRMLSRRSCRMGSLGPAALAHWHSPFQLYSKPPSNTTCAQRVDVSTSYRHGTRSAIKYWAYSSAASLHAAVLARGPGGAGGLPLPSMGVRCFVLSICSQCPRNGCGASNGKRLLLRRPRVPAVASRASTMLTRAPYV
eukprot:54183-Eustigmatos_ZCMA.PRE.2